MPWASAEVQAGHFDMIYHVGDFAYDFDSNNGTTGTSLISVACISDLLSC
jgi:hypothetical protein